MEVRKRLLAGASLLLGVVATAALGACGATGAPRSDQLPGSSSALSQSLAAPPVTSRLGATSHVAVIVMENEEYGSIIGSRSAPFINSLAERYALAESSYATSHPSLPNYLALTGGSTFGMNSDCTDCSVGATGIVDQLEGAHVSWKAFMENLPYPCFTGAGAGGYAKKHDPFVYYRRVVGNRAWCANVVPLARLSFDERRGTLPKFIWITPNLCHDMHDCAVAVGDRFLSTLVPGLLSALGPHGVLFLIWDEGSSDAGCCRLASGGHIAMIVAGSGARRGARLTSPADQYSVLRTVEDMLGLGRLKSAACACTPSLTPLLAPG